MTRSKENRVRKLVHGFLHDEITSVEFKEELALITGRKPRNKIRRAVFDQVSTPSAMTEDRGVIVQDGARLEIQGRYSLDS